MANPNLHLSVINDSNSYNRRKHAALAHIEGALSQERYRSTIRDICRAQAQVERVAFGVITPAADLKAATLAVCEYDIRHAWELFQLAPNATIIAHIRRWFDRVNGNSYFTALVTVPCEDGVKRSFLLPFQYGYGSHPEYTVWEDCIAHGILPDPGRHENGSRKGRPSQAPIHFVDSGYGRKRDLFGR